MLENLSFEDQICNLYLIRAITQSKLSSSFCPSKLFIIVQNALVSKDHFISWLQSHGHHYTVKAVSYFQMNCLQLSYLHPTAGILPGHCQSQEAE